jgi:hypothetical protein
LHGGTPLAQEEEDLEGTLQAKPLAWGEVDIEHEDFELPKCVYCKNPFSIRDGRTPYVLPCREHRSCKECLKVARANIDKAAVQNLACPLDGVAVDV